MTKQEVNNNIAYNERLIEQYQREIQSLRRQIDECYSRLSKCNSQYEQLLEKRKNHQAKIKESEDFRSKFKALQDDFQRLQKARKDKLKANFSDKPKVAFISAYIAGMEALLSGSQYHSANNGLSNASEQINKRITSLHIDYEAVQREICSLLNKIESIKQEINHCNRKIDELTGQISYRKQRINYWRSQLQYAT